MAGVLPVSAGFKRLAGNVSGSSDYACTFWAKRTDTIVSDYRTYFAQFNTAYTTWAGIYTDSGNEQLEFSTVNLSTSANASGPLVELNGWRPYGYSRQGTTHSWFEGGILAGTTVLDTSANVVDEQWLGQDGFSIGSMVIMLFREWDTFKTLAGLITEWNSPTVVDTVNLWSDCPFIANPNDISGNARHYTAVGAVTYATSPTPVPLTNTSSGAALDVTGVLPKELVQVASADGLAASIQNTWYKRTATVGDGNELGAFGWGGQPLVNGDYFPGTRIFQNGSFGGNYLGMPTSFDHPVQWPVTLGTTWYIELEKTFYNVGPLHTPAVAYLHLDAAPLTPPDEGDLYVNDDTSGFPAVVLSADTDYLVKRFYPGMPAGEAGDIASNGNFLLDDILSNDYKLFDIDSNLLLTYPSYGTFGYVIRTHRPTDSFYIAEVRNALAGNLTLKNISNVGVELSSLVLAGVTRTEGIAVNNAQTVLYHVRNTNGSPIHQHNLSVNVAMGDLVAGIPDYRMQDLLVLEDDTLVAMYGKLASTQSVIVHHYDTVGNILNTYDLSPYVQLGTMSFLPRLAYSWDTPLGSTFWVYIQAAIPEVGYVKFLKIQVNPEAVLVERNHFAFEFGVNPDDGSFYTNSPPAYFGPSKSCPFFELPPSLIPPECPGILGHPRQDGLTYTRPHFS